MKTRFLTTALATLLVWFAFLSVGSLAQAQNRVPPSSLPAMGTVVDTVSVSSYSVFCGNRPANSDANRFKYFTNSGPVAVTLFKAASCAWAPQFSVEIGSLSTAGAVTITPGGSSTIGLVGQAQSATLIITPGQVFDLYTDIVSPGCTSNGCYDAVQLGGVGSSGGGNASALAATNNVRYVQGINGGLSTGNGSDSNLGTSEGAGLGDLYTAMASLVNTNHGGGGTIYATTNGGIGGPIFPTPAGLFPQSNSLQGWIGIIGPNDWNLVSTVGSSRASGTVTVTTSVPVPVIGTPNYSTYWQIGKYISAFSCQDSSFNGSVFQIATVSGSTITYPQSGSTTSTIGCSYVPLGFVPQIGGGSFKFNCKGTSTTQNVGGLGSNCWVNEGFAPHSVAITSYSETGNLFTFVVADSSTFLQGIPVRIGFTPNSGMYTSDIFAIVNTVPDGTSFTVINPSSASVINPPSGPVVCSSNCGYAAQIIPGPWISGAQSVTFDGFNFTQPIGGMEGVNSDGNPAIGISPNGSGLGFNQFLNSTFSTPPNGYSDILFGPAFWAASNNVWGGEFHNDTFSANCTAPADSDLRASFLGQPNFNASSGLASGLFDIQDTAINCGGGFRFYAGSGSGGANIYRALQEGSGQSQPTFSYMNTGSLTFDINDLATSDSGNVPPTVYVAPGNMPSAVHVCFPNAQTGTVATQGPLTKCASADASGSTSPYTYNQTVPRVSSAAQGEVGIGQGKLINVDTNAARLGFSPSIQPFTNLATAPCASWTGIEGTSLTFTPVPGPDGVSTSACKVACTIVGVDNYCSGYIYSASTALNVGDYSIVDVWEKPFDQSAGERGGDEFGLNCCSNFPFTGFGLGAAYKSNQGSAGYNTQIGGSTANDGGLQHLFAWVQDAVTVTQTVDLEVRVDPAHPMIFYNPHYYQVTANQVAIPASCSTSQSASGSLAATTYYVRCSYTNATGETNVQSTDTVFSASANHVISVACPGASTGATGCNVYVGNDIGCAQSGRATVVPGDLTGPGQTCELKQNATPLAVGGTWTELTSGLNTSVVGYLGARGPAGQMEPTNDTTNIYGNSWIADIAANLQSAPPPALVASLPAASAANVGEIITVSDSTTVSAEGQTCAGSSSNTAIAISNGTQWKCF